MISVDNMIRTALVVLSVSASCLAVNVTFPPDFKFGAATAAYQVEGAWNVSDKSPSVWDAHTYDEDSKVPPNLNGDVACDSYHQWQRDIEMAVELGLDFYRFSISWTRLCPNGFCNWVSKDGTAYYNKLIDGLLAKGIEPVITIYHHDLPQRLQNLGGWANPLIVDWFAAYARVLFSLYADRVKTWITINEPLSVCDVVYGDVLTPLLMDQEVGAYLCSKNVLLAHAKAWRIYDEEYRPKHQGQISLTNHLIWYEPDSEEEAELTELAMQNSAGRFSHPIYTKEGGWPPTLEKYLAERSIQQKYPRSRLPPFTKEEIALIRGTYDYYGLNFYTSKVVYKAKSGGESSQIWPVTGSEELGIRLGDRPEWKNTTAWWYKQNAKGIRDQLNWLKQQYGPLKFLVLENGFPNVGSQIDDSERVESMQAYLTQLLMAIKDDGIDVRAYTVWQDENKFGIYQVDFEDPLRTRTARDSAHYYAQVIATHSVDGKVTLPEPKPFNFFWIGFGIAALLTAVGLFVFCRSRNKKGKERYAGVPLNENEMGKTVL